jgi:hypothetical protein
MICRAKVSEFPHPEFARDDVRPKRRFQQFPRRPSLVDVRADGILSLLRFCSCLGCGLLRGGRKHGKCCWQAMTTLSRMINETNERDRAIGLAHLYKFKKSILLHLISAGTPVCMCKACCLWHTTIGYVHTIIFPSQAREDQGLYVLNTSIARAHDIYQKPHSKP